MKSITRYTREEIENMQEKTSQIFNAVKDLKSKDYFDNFKKKFGYAHYTFSGTYNDLLVERLGRVPTKDDIIILVDNGFSHFGASCNISGKHFHGKVFID